MSHDEVRISEGHFHHFEYHTRLDTNQTGLLSGLSNNKCRAWGCIRTIQSAAHEKHVLAESTDHGLRARQGKGFFPLAVCRIIPGTLLTDLFYDVLRALYYIRE